jgi:hypothetical protein
MGVAVAGELRVALEIGPKGKRVVERLDEDLLALREMNSGHAAMLSHPVSVSKHL